MRHTLQGYHKRDCWRSWCPATFSRYDSPCHSRVCVVTRGSAAIGLMGCASLPAPILALCEQPVHFLDLDVISCKLLTADSQLALPTLVRLFGFVSSLCCMHAHKHFCLAQDVEFGQPGCNGTPSDFVSVYFAQWKLVAQSMSPVFLMPLLSAFGWLLQTERLSIPCFPNLTPKVGAELRYAYSICFPSDT